MDVVDGTAWDEGAGDEGRAGEVLEAGECGGVYGVGSGLGVDVEVAQGGCLCEEVCKMSVEGE